MITRGFSVTYYGFILRIRLCRRCGVSHCRSRIISRFRLTPLPGSSECCLVTLKVGQRMHRKTIILSVLLAALLGIFAQQVRAARGTLPNPYRPPVKSPSLPS